MDFPVFRQRWFRIGAPVVGVLILYALLHWRQPAETAAGWMVDLLAGAMVFFITLAFASQYILPVRTIRERRTALDRLFLYVFGGHGPIVFVRDGELQADPEELKRRGAGVILLDGSSGLVLERGRKFSRAAGPGIVFTQANERIAATLDLRRQARTQSTQALTQDGIELRTEVTVEFGLDPGEEVSPGDLPDDKNFFGRARITPAFPFNPDSAFKAVYGGAITEKEPLEWDDLPIIVAAESFRDQVSRVTLDDLFLPKDPDSSPVAALQSRLTAQVEFAPLLRERGIKVYSASAGLLTLPEEVTRQRLRSWATRWQKLQMTTLADGEAKAEQIKERARAEAQMDMLDQFKGFQDLLAADAGPINKEEITKQWVVALERVAGDPITRMLLPGDTMRQISNLRHWVDVTVESGAEPPKVIGQPEASEDLSEVVAALLNAGTQETPNDAVKTAGGDRPGEAS